MKRQKARIIAEVGCNHKGEMKIAEDLIKIAAIYCKVDVVKFQKRCNKELLTEEQYNSPHPNPRNSYGKTYGEHRAFLEFTLDQHRQLKENCENYGVVYCTSVWDLTSAREITSLKPDLIKIPSACNTNYEMLDFLCNNFGGEIHISLGMTTLDEENKLIELMEKNKRSKDVVLYACTSGYPVEDKDVCLLEIKRIKKCYGDVVKEIGFSGHHLGIAIDNAAYVLGATTLERHYTLNRMWKGTDHIASLEPNDLSKLRSGLDSIYEALSYKDNMLLPVEEMQRKKLKFKEK